MLRKSLTGLALRQRDGQLATLLETCFCRLQSGIQLAQDSSSATSSSWNGHSMAYSTASDDQKGKEQTPAGEQDPGQAEQPTENAEQHPYADFSREELSGMLLERDDALATCHSQLDEKVDQIKRTLADMENLRQRSARQAESTQKFAIQKFLKSMLDVGDNLERAYSAVPQEALEGRDNQGQKLSADAAVSLLVSLTDGVKLTEKIFDRGLQENGVEKIKPLGQTFDPNLHEALFEMPSADQKAGTVGAVTKTGYSLQGRVVRPAQVGVIRQQS